MRLKREIEVLARASSNLTDRPPDIAEIIPVKMEVNL
jgi:hypothetical protein